MRSGGGSIGRWLAERVGAAGWVTVTDIDPVWLAQAAVENLDVMRHDIAVDPLREWVFDLVHARLVLMYALRRMVSALKPGGWLFVEDFDMRVVRDGGDENMVRTPLSGSVTSADVERRRRVRSPAVWAPFRRGARRRRRRGICRGRSGWLARRGAAPRQV
jgi:SAM-dependent methyltransferase